MTFLCINRKVFSFSHDLTVFILHSGDSGGKCMFNLLSWLLQLNLQCTLCWPPRTCKNSFFILLSLNSTSSFVINQTHFQTSETLSLFKWMFCRCITFTSSSATFYILFMYTWARFSASPLISASALLSLLLMPCPLLPLTAVFT